MQTWRTSPDPRLLAPIEFVGRNDRHLVNLVAISESLTGERLPPKESPPTFLQIEPAGTFGNKDLMNAGMSLQPRHNRRALVAGEIVGDEVQISHGIVLLHGIQQTQVASSVARACGQGPFVPISNAQRSVDPHFFQSPAILQRRFDPMRIHRPTGSRGKAPRDHRTEFVEGEDRPVRGRSGVERDDLSPFGAKSGSVLFPQLWVECQRTLSRRRIRRTWLRSIWIPCSWAASTRASRVQCVWASASSIANVPSDSRMMAPGGEPLARAMIWLRSSSVRRGFLPCPGRSPRPSIPSALKRTRRSRTVWGWHPNSWAISVVRSPSQLRAIIRARTIQSPGAWRLWESRRIWRSSTSSWGSRACRSFGIVASLIIDDASILHLI